MKIIYSDSLVPFPIDNSDYGVELFAEFPNFTDTNLYRVEILRKGYASDMFQITNIEEVTIAHQGHGKEDWEKVIIQGQNLKFSFYVAQENVPLLENMLESDDYDYMVKFYVNGILEFIGWLQPENLSKNYFKNPPNVQISITAYDGIVNLKDEDFQEPNASYMKLGTPYTGRVNLLQVIKTALSRTKIPLDFVVQLNVWEGYTAPPPPEPVKVLETEEAVYIPVVVLTEDGKMIQIN